MTRELNKNEFLKVRRSYEDAIELFDQKLYKEALFVLKPVFKLLERDGIQTRMLAKCYMLQAEIFQQTGKPALKEWQKAKAVLASIHDQSELPALVDHAIENLTDHRQCDKKTIHTFDPF